MYTRTLASIGIAGVLIFSASIATQPASALTVEEVQSQIKELLLKVAELTKQLNILKGVNISAPSTTTVSSDIPTRHRICAILYRNLSQGTTGDDVTGLQEFLREEGYFSTNTTGYFGPITAAALARWQVAQGVEGAGAVGPITRERIKLWCGQPARFSVTPHAGTAPLSVTFKALVGGFTPYRYAIDFGDGSAPQEIRCPESPNTPDVCGGPAVVEHTYGADGAYTAVLWQFGAGASATDAGRVAIAKEVIRVGSNIACTKEYRPVCGSKQVVCITAPCNPVQQTYGNRCMMEADGATFLYEGACRVNPDPSSDPLCKSWYDGCNSCSRSEPGGLGACTLRYCSPEAMQKPYCTARFPDSGVKPPVISSFSSPTILAVNEIDTWTIQASDPENRTLTYRIMWGDENTLSNQASVSGGTFVQTSTFTHAYSVAGTYTVTVIVRNSGGKEARASATVKVGDSVICTAEYAPVCGQPPEPACRNSIPACMMPTPGPQTYSNRCLLQAAGATLLYEGQCSRY